MELQQNPHQVIFDVYKEVAAITLKSYLNLQLSSIVAKYSQDGNATEAVDLDGNRQTFLRRYDDIQSRCVESLGNADRKKWACDRDNSPGDCVRFVLASKAKLKLFSSTAVYHQITRFIQGYVDNEVNLNPDSSCKKTCSDYTKTSSYGCSADSPCDPKNEVDPVVTRCNGTILNCEFINDELTLCPVSKQSTIYCPLPHSA